MTAYGDRGLPGAGTRRCRSQARQRPRHGAERASSRGMLDKSASEAASIGRWRTRETMHPSWPPCDRSSHATRSWPHALGARAAARGAAARGAAADTEIFLAPFSAGATPAVGPPVNITNSPGYDNQPSFTPDGAAMLFTSIRGGGRRPTSTGTTSRRRATHARDQHAGERILADRHARRRAHLRDPRRSRRHAAALALHDRRPRAGARAGRRQAGRLPRVGRRSHARAVRARLAGDAAARRHADRHARESSSAGIDRSIQRIPGGGTISFVQRVPPARAGGAPTLSIRELDPKTRRDHAARGRGRRRARGRLRVDAGRHAGDGGEGRAVRLAREAMAAGGGSPISPRSGCTASRGSRSARRAIASRSSRSRRRERQKHRRGR